MKKEYKYIFFDFDGTMANTLPCITQSFINTFEYYGITKPSVEQVHNKIGIPLVDMIQAYLDESGTADKFVAFDMAVKYRDIYDVIQYDLISEYEGMLDLLNGLKKENKIISVVTSKNTNKAHRESKLLNYDSYIDAILGNDMVDKHKPHPEPIYKMINILQEQGHSPEKDKILMIGDSLFDIQMAHAAQVDSCGVTWGVTTKSGLTQVSPNYIVDTVYDLKDIVL